MTTKAVAARARKTSGDVFLNLRLKAALCQRIDRAAVHDRRATRADMARVALMVGLEELERRWQLEVSPPNP